MSGVNPTTNDTGWLPKWRKKHQEKPLKKAFKRFARDINWGDSEQWAVAWSHPAKYPDLDTWTLEELHEVLSPFLNSSAARDDPDVIIAAAISYGRGSVADDVTKLRNELNRDRALRSLILDLPDDDNTRRAKATALIDRLNAILHSPHPDTTQTLAYHAAFYSTLYPSGNNFPAQGQPRNYDDFQELKSTATKRTLPLADENAARTLANRVIPDAVTALEKSAKCVRVSTHSEPHERFMWNLRALCTTASAVGGAIAGAVLAAVPGFFAWLQRILEIHVGLSRLDSLSSASFVIRCGLVGLLLGIIVGAWLGHNARARRCVKDLKKAWRTQHEAFAGTNGALGSYDHWRAIVKASNPPSREIGGITGLINQAASYFSRFHQDFVVTVPEAKLRLAEDTATEFYENTPVAWIKEELRGERRVSVGLAGDRGSGKTATLARVAEDLPKELSETGYWFFWKRRLRHWTGRHKKWQHDIGADKDPVKARRRRETRAANRLAVETELWRQWSQDRSLVVKTTVPSNYDNREFLELLGRKLVDAISSTACRVGRQHRRNVVALTISLSVLLGALTIWILSSLVWKSTRVCPAAPGPARTILPLGPFTWIFEKPSTCQTSWPWVLPLNLTVFSALLIIAAVSLWATIHYRCHIVRTSSKRICDFMKSRGDDNSGTVGGWPYSRQVSDALRRWQQLWNLIVRLLLAGCAVLLGVVATGFIQRGDSVFKGRRVTVPIPSLQGRALSWLVTLGLGFILGLALFLFVRWWRAGRNRFGFDQEIARGIREAERQMDRAVVRDPGSGLPQYLTENAQAMLKIARLEDKAFKKHYPDVVRQLARLRSLLGHGFWQRQHWRFAWTSPWADTAVVESSQTPESKPLDIVRLISALEELLTACRKAHTTAITVLIDEADKTDVDRHRQLLDQLKDLFSFANVRWLVTIRQDVADEFDTQRIVSGKPRSYLDSIVTGSMQRLEPMTVTDLLGVLYKRVPLFAVSAVAFCAVFSLGVPRDFLRYLRQIQREFHVPSSADKGLDFMTFATACAERMMADELRSLEPADRATHDRNNYPGENSTETGQTSQLRPVNPSAVERYHDILLALITSLSAAGWVSRGDLKPADILSLEALRRRLRTAYGLSNNSADEASCEFALAVRLPSPRPSDEQRINEQRIAAKRQILTIVEFAGRVACEVTREGLAIGSVVTKEADGALQGWCAAFGEASAWLAVIATSLAENHGIWLPALDELSKTHSDSNAGVPAITALKAQLNVIICAHAAGAEPEAVKEQVDLVIASAEKALLGARMTEGQAKDTPPITSEAMKAVLSQVHPALWNRAGALLRLVDETPTEVRITLNLPASPSPTDVAEASQSIVFLASLAQAVAQKSANADISRLPTVTAVELGSFTVWLTARGDAVASFFLAFLKAVVYKPRAFHDWVKNVLSSPKKPRSQSDREAAISARAWVQTLRDTLRLANDLRGSGADGRSVDRLVKDVLDAASVTVKAYTPADRTRLVKVLDQLEPNQPFDDLQPQLRLGPPKPSATPAGAPVTAAALHGKQPPEAPNPGTGEPQPVVDDATGPADETNDSAQTEDPSAGTDPATTLTPDPATPTGSPTEGLAPDAQTPSPAVLALQPAPPGEPAALPPGPERSTESPEQSDGGTAVAVNRPRPAAPPNGRGTSPTGPASSQPGETPFIPRSPRNE